MSKKVYTCKLCGGAPCRLETPSGTPEVCPFPEDEGAEFADWRAISDRRKEKKTGGD